MKVALLFAGRIKSFEHCFHSFNQHILDPLTGHSVDGYAALNIENTHHGLDDFIRLYNIKKYINLDMNINLYDTIPINRVIGGKKNSYKMYYCWLNAFKLMEESGIVYDLIIYLRADQKFHSSLLIPPKPLADILYVPTGYDYGGLNDQMAMGNFTVMKHYTNLYNCIPDIYYKTKLLFHTETYVKEHNTCFPVERFYLSYELHPMRVG